ncbi:DNA polymerase IV [Nocardia sp. GAS34]|uniref:Y-family DNA polymerase n=1 Tax=unclassified Nocardia TaxID=2637762 RepID=UPI003D2445CF
MPRWLLHVDLDQFQAAVEYRRHPELRGSPIIVGGHGDPAEPRKVVTCASYPARGYGVRAGMPLRTAARKCPGAVFLPLDIPTYEEASEQVMDLLRTFPVRVEVLGWDEAFLAADTDDPERLAREIRSAIAALDLTCAVGIGDNKLRAKLATGFAKSVGKGDTPVRIDDKIGTDVPNGSDDSGTQNGVDASGGSDGTGGSDGSDSTDGTDGTDGAAVSGGGDGAGDSNGTAASGIGGGDSGTRDRARHPDAGTPESVGADGRTGTGIFRLTAANWTELMANRPTSALWGVGARIAKRMEALGITTIAELAAADRALLAAEFGPNTGPYLWVLGHGMGDTEVVTEPRIPVGHSKSETFPKDLTERADIDAAVVRLATAVAEEVAATGRITQRVGVTVRTSTFYTRTKQRKLPAPTTDVAEIAHTALEVLARFELDRPIRLLGVRLELVPE